MARETPGQHRLKQGLTMGFKKETRMTNLITAQRNSRNLSTMLDDVQPVTIWFDNESDVFTTKYGPVSGRPRVGSHRSNQNARPCCHALEPPTRCELFSLEWVAQMTWQPTIYPCVGTPMIASRQFNLVTLAFDVVGPTLYCTHTPLRLEERNKFSYKLFPFQFWDEDTVYTKALLGVWPD